MIVQSKEAAVKPYIHKKMDTAGCIYISLHTYTHTYVAMLTKKKVINLRVGRNMEGFERGYGGRRREKKKMMSYCFNLKNIFFKDTPNCRCICKPFPSFQHSCMDLKKCTVVSKYMYQSPGSSHFNFDFQINGNCTPREGTYQT